MRLLHGANFRGATGDKSQQNNYSPVVCGVEDEGMGVQHSVLESPLQGGNCVAAAYDVNDEQRYLRRSTGARLNFNTQKLLSNERLPRA